MYRIAVRGGPGLPALPRSKSTHDRKHRALSFRPTSLPPRSLARLSRARARHCAHNETMARLRRGGTHAAFLLVVFIVPALYAVNAKLSW